jgi:hypothetical protein
MCTSVPQMVVVVMRSSASFGPTEGRGLSTSSMRLRFDEDCCFHHRCHGESP